MKGRDSNLRLIIGSIVAGLVALAAVVCLVALLTKRKKRCNRTNAERLEVS